MSEEHTGFMFEVGFWHLCCCFFQAIWNFPTDKHRKLLHTGSTRATSTNYTCACRAVRIRACGWLATFFFDTWMAGELTRSMCSGAG